MLRLKDIKIVCSMEELAAIPEGKVLINTINAHSYNTAQKDELFAESLLNGDALIPDGASVVKACRWLNAKSQPKERIAGWDLFEFEMGRLEAPLNPPRRGKPVIILPEDGRESAAPRDSLDESDSPLDLHEPSWDPINMPKVMFMGSSEKVLRWLLIRRLTSLSSLTRTMRR